MELVEGASQEQGKKTQQGMQNIGLIINWNSSNEQMQHTEE